MKGDSEIVLLLLKKGRPLTNVCDQWGNTPLSYALDGRHEDTASLLLEHNSRVDIQDGQGASPYPSQKSPADIFTADRQRPAPLRCALWMGGVRSPAPVHRDRSQYRHALYSFRYVFLSQLLILPLEGETMMECQVLHRLSWRLVEAMLRLFHFSSRKALISSSPHSIREGLLSMRHVIMATPTCASPLHVVGVRAHHTRRFSFVWLQVVKALLSAHAKISAVDKWGQSPLHLAGASPPLSLLICP